MAPSCAAVTPSRPKSATSQRTGRACCPLRECCARQRQPAGDDGTLPGRGRVGDRTPTAAGVERPAQHERVVVPRVQQHRGASIGQHCARREGNPGRLPRRWQTAWRGSRPPRPQRCWALRNSPAAGPRAGSAHLPSRARARAYPSTQRSLALFKGWTGAPQKDARGSLRPAAGLAALRKA